MPTYTIKTPQGTFDVNSDKELSDAEAYSYAMKGTKMPELERRSTDRRAPVQEYDPAEGMNWGQKALVGAGGGLRRMYLGAKDLVGQGTQDEADELKEWNK